jgi:hypothetical protein
MRNAQHVLEHSVKHLACCGEPAYSVRISALAALRDVLLERTDFETAIALQREIVECRTQLAGPDDLEVISEKAGPAGMLMSNSTHVATA